MVAPQSQNVHKLPQERIVSATHPLAGGLSFMCFVVRLFWRTIWLSTAYLSVSGWNLWLEPFRFHVNCSHCRGAVFVHVGSSHFCAGNVVSFYMCIAVEVAWLVQNIRHNSNTCVIASTLAFRCLKLIITIVHILRYSQAYILGFIG